MSARIDIMVKLAGSLLACVIVAGPAGKPVCVAAQPIAPTRIVSADTSVLAPLVNRCMSYLHANE